MPTTIRLPRTTLAALDESARAQGISRSRYIALAVEKSPAAERPWRPEVLRAFQPGPTDEEDRETVKEMLSIIAAGRTRKTPAVQNEKNAPIWKRVNASLNWTVSLAP